MIAMLLTSTLEDEHCTIVGPCHRLADALTLAQEATIDLAVLDINLSGELVFPVAELLSGRGVPFVLLSGYGDQKLPADRPHWPVCGKPFQLQQFISILEILVAPG